ncbi:MAG: hypothetical protein ACLPV2_15040 [Steroidobacteraceae bacterium]
MNQAAKLGFCAGVLLGLVSCGGGLTAATPSYINAGADVPTPASGAPTAIVRVPGGAPGTGPVVALFSDGTAYYSPDGFNLMGGGSTVPAYVGPLQVFNIVAVGGGIDALLSDGTVNFSPDGMNLGGGGATVSAYSGTVQITALTPVGSGVDAVLADGRAYYSPDGRNLGGGGASVAIYTGGKVILQIVPVGAAPAVVTLFQDGTAFFSPNNRDLGGGGATMSAAPGAPPSITGLIQVGGGVLAAFEGGSVYLSPDGQNLAGGGATVYVSAWDASVPNGPFGPRDSAHGTEFAGHLWLSGGFSDPTGANGCFNTCSYFDLWSSTDLTGTTWNGKPNFATATVPDPRDNTPVVNNGVQDPPLPTDFYDSYSAIVVWNSRLFAIGGTVWSSADGTHWARQNLADGVTAAPGPVTMASENSRALQLGTSLFFLQPDNGEVYSTTDPQAATWTDLGAIQGFTPRCGAAAFVLLGKLWIEGGGACDYSQVYSDIWSSADGINWTQMANGAQWSARMWPCIAPGDDGIVWLAGGYAPTDWNNSGGTLTVRYGANHSDVWYSKDGATWRQFKADNGAAVPDGTALEPRHAPTCYVGEGSSAATKSLIVLGGTGGPDPNDANARVVNSIRTLALPATSALP